MAAALSLATYGTPTAQAPIVIQGYTSAAGDGGIGEISGAATYSIFATTLKTVYFADMKIGNCGAAAILPSSVAVGAVNCEIYGSSASPAISVTAGHVTGCYIHSCTGDITVTTTGDYLLYGNYIHKTAGGTAHNVSTGVCVVLNNLFVLATDTSMHAIRNAVGGIGFVIGNTIYSSAANTDDAIEWQDIRGGVFLNNVVYGWSGAGGTGMTLNYFGAANGFVTVGGNAFYNNTTAKSILSSVTYIPSADLALGASPFVNAGAGNFALDPTGDAVEAAWPSLFKGLATTDILADIGAVQAGAGAGGGTVNLLRGKL